MSLKGKDFAELERGYLAPTPCTCCQKFQEISEAIVDVDALPEYGFFEDTRSSRTAESAKDNDEGDNEEEQEEGGRHLYRTTNEARASTNTGKEVTILAPFKLCVALDGYLGGGCINDWYVRTTKKKGRTCCSLVTQGMYFKIMLPLQQNAKKVFMKPRMADLISVQCDRYRFLKFRPKGADTSVSGSPYKQLPRQSNDLPSTRGPVICWCINSEADSKFTCLYANDAGDRMVDTDPHWTIGHTRPMFVPRRHQSNNYPPDMRLVPVDEKIPLTTLWHLSNFWFSFREYPEAVLAAMLDTWPSSSGKPREKR